MNKKNIPLYLSIGVVCLLFLANLVLAALYFGESFFDTPLIGALIWIGINIGWILISLYKMSEDSITI